MPTDNARSRLKEIFSTLQVEIFLIIACFYYIVSIISGDSIVHNENTEKAEVLESQPIEIIEPQIIAQPPILNAQEFENMHNAIIHQILIFCSLYANGKFSKEKLSQKIKGLKYNWLNKHKFKSQDIKTIMNHQTYNIEL